jgi:hypothetical protein
MALPEHKPSLFNKLTHFFTKAFYSKGDKKQQKQVDNLFKKESPQQWESFADKVKDPNYLKVLKDDPRSDSKLKLHADSLHKLHNGSEVSKVKGSRGTYTIKKLSDGSLGCTCNDWKYVRSVSAQNRDCKHIQKYKRDQKNA